MSIKSIPTLNGQQREITQCQEWFIKAVGIGIVQSPIPFSSRYSRACAGVGWYIRLYVEESDVIFVEAAWDLRPCSVLEALVQFCRHMASQPCKICLKGAAVKDPLFAAFACDQAGRYFINTCVAGKQADSLLAIVDESLLGVDQCGGMETLRRRSHLGALLQQNQLILCRLLSTNRYLWLRIATNQSVQSWVHLSIRH